MILAIFSNHSQAENLSIIITILMITALVFGLSSGRLFTKIPDKFDIGYIEDRPIQYSIIHSTAAKERKAASLPKPKVTKPIAPKEDDELETLKRKVQIAKLKRELEELEKPIFNNDLFDDCINILVGLGVPKRKAKAEAQVIFEKYPNIKDHNEFIEKYGKR